MNDDDLFWQQNWTPVWLKDPGKAILGWPALWDLPRLFATPAKTRLRLKTAENTKWSRYIQDKCFCNNWKHKDRQFIPSIWRYRSVQLIYLNNKSPHLNKILPLPLAVHGKQDGLQARHCLFIWNYKSWQSLEVFLSQFAALSLHLKLQILIILWSLSIPVSCNTREKRKKKFTKWILKSMAKGCLCRTSSLFDIGRVTYQKFCQSAQ